MEQKIDFVIIWVDGNDPEWQKEKDKYSGSMTGNNDSREIRYRDWDNLHYWFRAVEKFAPWVNKIHFVTSGHLPPWLNTEHPKLNIVKHSDFIPEKYLPTFSSHPIELNLHRIKDLSENFVFFNDDVFLTRPVKPTDFFAGGKPKDAAILNANISHRENNNHAESANMDVINSHFNKNTVIKQHFTKWFNLKYGAALIRTLCLMPWHDFAGILNAHLTNAFCKSTFELVWEKEAELLDEVSTHKFRQPLDVNQWLMEDWQLVTGNFVPRSTKFGKSYAMSSDQKFNEYIYSCIKKQKYRVLCVNDMVLSDDFERLRDELKAAFNVILPTKSEFEK